MRAFLSGWRGAPRCAGREASSASCVSCKGTPRLTQRGVSILGRGSRFCGTLCLWKARIQRTVATNIPALSASPFFEGLTVVFHFLNFDVLSFLVVGLLQRVFTAVGITCQIVTDYDATDITPVAKVV